MNKILQVTESMFEGHHGDVSDALLEPFNRESKLVSIMTRATRGQVELLDDIAKQLGVSRASFLSMALDDAIKTYQLALFETGITEHHTMRGFNPEEDM
jgi:hypothetical protein